MSVSKPAFFPRVIKFRPALIGALALLLIFTVIIAPARANEPPLGQRSVTVSGLNVRIGPDVASPPVAQLKPGDTVTVVSADSAGGWWLVRLPGGQTGWIWDGAAVTRPVDSAGPDSPAITITARLQDLPTQQIYVDAPQLSVRIGPGVGYAVVTQLKQGQIVTALKQDAGGWWLVRLPDDQTGWVSNAPGLIRLLERDHYAALPINSTGTIVFQPYSGGPIYALEAAALNSATPPQPRYLDTGVDPALSPDGTQLAYTVYTSVGGGTFPSETGALWIYDLKTGQKRAVLEEMYEPKAPTWSADGTEIILNHQAGGRLTEEQHCFSQGDAVDEIPENAFDIHYGKDGGVCYKILPDTEWKLRRVQVANGQFTDLTSERYAFAPTWDPVNPWRVVFYTPFNGLLQLDLNRSVYFPFFSMPVKMFGPVFSPDGGKVAVTFWLHNHWEIYTVDSATAALIRLTTGEPLSEGTASSAAPAWSPDGRQLLFISNRNGAWQPWIMDADGSNARLLLSAETAGKLEFAYNGVNERLFSWR